MNHSVKYAGMGEFLFRKWHDGDIDPDDWHQDDIGHESFAQFGRRVLIDIEGCELEYSRFDTVSEACRRMEQLHEDRAPVEWDALVSEDRGGYSISLEGVSGGEFESRDEATRGLAQMMVDHGCFPEAFYVNGRGNWFRIDSEVRECHDAGGTEMLGEGT